MPNRTRRRRLATRTSRLGGAGSAIQSSTRWSIAPLRKTSTSRVRRRASAKPGPAKASPARPPCHKCPPTVPSPVNGSARTPFPSRRGAGGGDGRAFGPPGAEFTTWRAGFDASWEIRPVRQALAGRSKRRGREPRRRYLEPARCPGLDRRRGRECLSGAAHAAATDHCRRGRGRASAALRAARRRTRPRRAGNGRGLGAATIGARLGARRDSPAAGAGGGADPRARRADRRCARSADRRAVARRLLPPRLPQVPAGLPSDLLRRRPDIRVAERNLAAATADIGVATADLYPRFSLSAAPALVSTALASLLEWGSRSFTAGAAIDWPMFNGGRTRANIDVANAAQEQALIAYRKTVLAALQDVEDALANLDNDRRQVANLERGGPHRCPRGRNRAHALPRRPRYLFRRSSGPGRPPFPGEQADRSARNPGARHRRAVQGARRRLARTGAGRRRSHEPISPAADCRRDSLARINRLALARRRTQARLPLGLYRRRQSQSRRAGLGD